MPISFSLSYNTETLIIVVLSEIVDNADTTHAIDCLLKRFCIVSITIIVRWTCKTVSSFTLLFKANVIISLESRKIVFCKHFVYPAYIFCRVGIRDVVDQLFFRLS